MKNTFEIAPILTGADSERIRRQAVRVLAEIGIECSHTPTLQLMQERSHASAANGRLRFDADEIEAHIEERKRQCLAQAPAAGAVPFRLGGQWNCLNFCEPMTHAIRPAEESDAVAMARLADALGSCRCPIPVAPGYVPAELRTLESERIALLYTRSCGGLLTATDHREIRFMAEMNRAAGRETYRLGIEGLISPLRVNPGTMEVFFENRDAPGVELVALPAIPLAGATAPLLFPAALAQILAESIGWDFLVSRLSGGKMQCLSLRLEPFDMRDGNIAIGTPEWCLFYRAVANLFTSVFGATCLNGSFRSNAKHPDVQAQVQRTASVLWQALLGCRSFGAVGQLCMDEVFSPVQAIYDREILRYVERLSKGLGDIWNEEDDTLEIIRSGIEQGGFLGVASTTENFRKAYWFSGLFDAKNLGAWVAAGKPDKEAAAWEQARELIRNRDFELDPSSRREVENIYRRARETLRR